MSFVLAPSPLTPHFSRTIWYGVFSFPESFFIASLFASPLLPGLLQWLVLFFIIMIIINIARSLRREGTQHLGYRMPTKVFTLGVGVYILHGSYSSQDFYTLLIFLLRLRRARPPFNRPAPYPRFVYLCVLPACSVAPECAKCPKILRIFFFVFRFQFREWGKGSSNSRRLEIRYLYARFQDCFFSTFFLFLRTFGLYLWPRRERKQVVKAIC